MLPKMVTAADGTVSLTYESDEAAAAQAANAATETARMAQQDADREFFEEQRARRIAVVQDSLPQEALPQKED